MWEFSASNLYISTLLYQELCVVVFSVIEQSSGSDGGPIKAPAPMWRCSRIMHLLRDLHPTLLSALEGIVDQVYCNTFECSKYVNIFQELNIVI